MAYLRDYEFDVFVSYSLVNDELKLDGKPWVKGLVDMLTSRLRNLLPDNGKDVSFYYAGKTLQYGDSLASCRDEARKSALFLIIGSPRYLDMWPTSELRAFSEEPGASRRIFIAELLPLHAEQSYPEQIGDIFRAEFWTRTERGSPSPRRADDQDFEDTLTDFASALSRHLIELHERSEAPLTERKPNPAFSPVLLARVTDDLEPMRRGLRTYLEQFEIEVLPSPEDFQEEGAEFAEEFTAQLARKPIVVQLLGAYPARRTRALPNGFDGLQDQLARKAPELRLFKWRERDLLERTTVDDEAHLQLLTNDVLAMDFEEFKDLIKRKATSPPPSPAPTEGKKTNLVTFIDADPVDAEIARKVLRECRELKKIAMMPEFGVDTAKDWRANYADADRVTLIHQHSDTRWLTSQLRLFVKTSAKSRRLRECLIYLGGPPPKWKDSVSVAHPCFQFVEAPDGDLSALLSQL